MEHLTSRFGPLEAIGVFATLEKTLRQLVKSASDQAINVRYLRTYASSV